MENIINEIYKRLVQFRVFEVILSTCFLAWTHRLIDFLLSHPEAFTDMAFAAADSSTMALIGGTLVWCLKQIAGKREKDE